MDLADKVIQANEQEIIEKNSNDSAPDGFYTDDLGFWVEQDIRRHKSRFHRFFRLQSVNYNRSTGFPSMQQDDNG